MINRFPKRPIPPPTRQERVFPDFKITGFVYIDIPLILISFGGLLFSGLFLLTQS